MSDSEAERSDGSGGSDEELARIKRRAGPAPPPGSDSEGDASGASDAEDERRGMAASSSRSAEVGDVGSQPQRTGKKKGKKVDPEQEKRDLQARQELNAKMKKYRRGEESKIKGVQDKKLKSSLRKVEKKYRDALKKSAGSELLLASEAGYLEAEGMEKTYHFRQEQIKEHLDVNTAKKMLDLKLEQLGPYNIDFTRNGRYMVIGGRKGHLALLDWSRGKLVTELQVQETVRDVRFLHNETMWAVAQKKYTYIYDKNGVEVHCLKKHESANRLEFLPYHFLLVSASQRGWLRYQDISTGKLVAEWRTKLGPIDCLRQNPRNAVVHMGHNNGVVTLWSPNMSAPLVKVLAHRGPVRAIAIDASGQHMVSAGQDGQVKVWDLRTYRNLHSYFSLSPVDSLDVSQRGLLSVAHGPHIEIWKDAIATKAKAPYMSELLAGRAVRGARFCPYEDVLGVGHSGGVATLVVPGAGEPNYDTLEADPFETRKQRREQEVHRLLEKLQPEMIGLEPDAVGTVRRSAAEAHERKQKLAFEANNPGERFEEQRERRKMKGRNRAAHRAKLREEAKLKDKRGAVRSHINEVEQKQKRQAAGEKRKREGEAAAAGAGSDGEAPARGSALNRFFRAKR
eukprot:tig00001366_g8379.t1